MNTYIKTMTLCFIMLLLLFGCRKQNELKIYIHQNNEYEFSQYLNQFLNEDSFLIVGQNKEGEEILLTHLKQVMTVISVTEKNLANMNVLDYKDTGEPYKRKRVSFDQEGNYIVEESDNFRIEYNPTHPYASKEGYVLYPSIVEEEELATLAYFQKLADVFRTGLKTIYNSYIFPEVSTK